MPLTDSGCAPLADQVRPQSFELIFDRDFNLG